MKLTLSRCELRSWEARDVESIATQANNRQIWLNLRDRFPHPYTKADAQRFIRESRKAQPECNFAIAVDGQAVGGAGFLLQSDVERISAEFAVESQIESSVYGRCDVDNGNRRNLGNPESAPSKNSQRNLTGRRIGSPQQRAPAENQAIWRDRTRPTAASGPSNRLRASYVPEGY